VAGVNPGRNRQPEGRVYFGQDTGGRALFGFLLGFVTLKRMAIGFGKMEPLMLFGRSAFASAEDFFFSQFYYVFFTDGGQHPLLFRSVFPRFSHIFPDWKKSRKNGGGPFHGKGGNSTPNGGFGRRGDGTKGLLLQCRAGADSGTAVSFHSLGRFVQARGGEPPPARSGGATDRPFRRFASPGPFIGGGLLLDVGRKPRAGPGASQTLGSRGGQRT